jgi:hypothetical protein
MLRGYGSISMEKSTYVVVLQAQKLVGRPLNKKMLVILLAGKAIRMNFGKSALLTGVALEVMQFGMAVERRICDFDAPPMDRLLL